jgi:hypothetical protein
MMIKSYIPPHTFKARWLLLRKKWMAKTQQFIATIATQGALKASISPISRGFFPTYPRFNRKFPRIGVSVANIYMPFIQ